MKKSLITAALFLISSCSEKKIVRAYGPGFQDAISINNLADIAPNKNFAIKLDGPALISNYPSSSFGLFGTTQNMSSASLYKNISETSYSSYNKGFYRANNLPIFTGDKIIYLGSNANILAFSKAQPNKIIWTSKLENSKNLDGFFGGGVFIHENIAYVTYGGTRLVAVDVNSGQEVWSYNLANISRSAPLVFDNKVFTITADNKLYAFDLKGNLLWANEGAIQELGIIGNSSLVGYKNIIITPTTTGQLIAFDVKTQEYKWSVNLIESDIKLSQSILPDVQISPIVHEDVVYTSSNAGTIFAINATSGDVKWVQENTANGKYLAISGNVIYTINKQNILFALSKNDGTIVWQKPLLNLEKANEKSNKNKNYNFYGPSLINGKLHISSSEGYLLIFNALNGELEKKLPINKAIAMPAYAFENITYFAGTNGNLYKIN
jgi:outer membrane protein assembly factor BamB